MVEFQASEAALKALSWSSKAADATSEPFQHQVLSLLSVAGWLCGGFPRRYDNEFKGFIEFTINPRNSRFLRLSRPCQLEH